MQHLTLGHVFHADLSDAVPNETYWLQSGGKKYPLIAHTKETLDLAIRENPHFNTDELTTITHYTADPVPMPLGLAIRISVRYSNNAGNQPNGYGIHHIAIHATPGDDETIAMARAGEIKTETKPLNYTGTAEAFLFHHADLITKDAGTYGKIMGHMTSRDNYPLVKGLALKMRIAGTPGFTSGWANWSNPIDRILGPEDVVLECFQLVPTAHTLKHARKALSKILISTKNDPCLNGKCWAQQQGTSVETQSQTSNSGNTVKDIQFSEIEVAADPGWTVNLTNSNKVQGLQSTVTVLNLDTQQIQLDISNYFVRYLGIYITFYDVNGNPIDLDAIQWLPDSNSAYTTVANDLGLSYTDCYCLGITSPIDTIFAIPIKGDPGSLTVQFTFPANAVSAKIYGCGLGTGSNTLPLTPVIGGVLTGLVNFAIPSFMLAAETASQINEGIYEITDDANFIATIVGLVAAKFTTQVTSEGIQGQIDWGAFIDIGQILFSKGCEKLLALIITQMAGEEVEDEIPFAGWVMLAVEVASDLAEMAETIVEICSSDWMIANTINQQIISTVTVYPDPRNPAGFPTAPDGTALTYAINMIYQSNQPTQTTGQIAVDSDPSPASVSGTFTNVLGGKVKFEANFYIGTWVAAKATTGWMDNTEANTQDITMYLIEVPVPLTAASVYTHQQILGCTEMQGNLTWIETTTGPVSTISDLDNSNLGNAISMLTGLALSQRSPYLGFSWQAAGTGLVNCAGSSTGQLNALQEITVPSAAFNSLMSNCGLSAYAPFVFDSYPPKFEMINGQWVVENGQLVPDPNDLSLGNYFVDPSKANVTGVDYGYHLRQVATLGSSPIIPASGSSPNSFGRFPYNPDSMILHPSGFAIGLNKQYCKLMITPIAAGTGLPDDGIPFAKVFAGKALDQNGSGGRPGLLFTPVAIASSYDGTIFILEQINDGTTNISRIQAFDFNGNPVNYFFEPDNNNSSPVLQIPGSVTYLDLKVTGDSHATYLYILYYTNDGSDPSDYNMAIYQVNQGLTPILLVTTPSIPAAYINVDMWHTLYTLNYQMTKDSTPENAGPAGNNVPAAGATVPSVSMWMPPLPSGN